MKNKTLIIIGAIVVLLAIISVVGWFALKPSEDPEASEISINKSVLSELPEEETKPTAAPPAEMTAREPSYRWDEIIEPSISENYVILTVAGGNGEWQVFENKDSYTNGYKPEGGAIIIE